MSKKCIICGKKAIKQIKVDLDVPAIYLCDAKICYYKYYIKINDIDLGKKYN